jgi:succinate-acetate transporter protein
MSGQSSDGVPDPNATVARIVVRPLGSPLPLGFFVFALGTLLFSAYELEWIPQTETHSVALMLLGGVFPAQFLATIFCFLTRDTAGATTLGTLSSTWLGVGLVLLTQPTDASAHTIGWYILGITGALVLFAALALAGRGLFGLALVVAVPRYLLLGLFEVSGATGLRDASGYLGLLLVAVAGYTALALMVEDTSQRTVLPLLRRGLARNAVEGSLEDQFNRLRNEAGVRSQL